MTTKTADAGVLTTYASLEAATRATLEDLLRARRELAERLEAFTVAQQQLEDARRAHNLAVAAETNAAADHNAALDALDEANR